MSPERVSAHLAMATDELDRITDWLLVSGHGAAVCLSTTARDLHDLRLEIERQTLVRVPA